ncbi:MAG TPA: DUF2312 domain-containing protein [Magnetococcales bacterium]|nr:DUF2312 domain-containing protein [Magnetococcales bacterium]
MQQAHGTATAAVQELGIPGEELRVYIERIERLEEEKTQLGQDIRDLYLEAKGNGFDPKVMKEIIKLRKKDPEEIDEEDAVLHLYKQALGMTTTAPTLQ